MAGALGPQAPDPVRLGQELLRAGVLVHAVGGGIPVAPILSPLFLPRLMDVVVVQWEVVSVAAVAVAVAVWPPVAEALGRVQDGGEDDEEEEEEHGRGEGVWLGHLDQREKERVTDGRRAPRAWDQIELLKPPFQ